MTQHRRSAGLKVIGVLAVPTIAALALTGCSSSAGSNSSAGGSKEFSLSFATSNTIESPFQVLAEDSMKSHPDVKITFNPQPNDSYDQTLRTQLQAGTDVTRPSAPYARRSTASPRMRTRSGASRSGIGSGAPMRWTSGRCRARGRSCH